MICELNIVQKNNGSPAPYETKFFILKSGMSLSLSKWPIDCMTSIPVGRPTRKLFHPNTRWKLLTSDQVYDCWDSARQNSKIQSQSSDTSWLCQQCL